MTSAISRRQMLKMLGAGVAGAALAACQPQTVIVEKIVKETTIVQGESVEVTRIVEKQVPVAKEKVTLRWGRHINAAEQPVYEYTEESWAKLYPDAELQVEEVPWADYWQKILTQAAAGQAPDVMWVGGMYLPQFWSKGVVKDITPLLDSDPDIGPADFFELWMRFLRFEGKYYYLPVRGATFSLYYNKELFDAAGLDYPTDEWKYEDEWFDAAQKLTVSDGDRTTQYGCYMNGMSLALWYNLFPSFDALIVTEDNCSLALAEPNAIYAYQWMADLALEHGVNMKPGDTDTPAPELFETGKVAMFMDGNTQRARFEKIEAFEWDVAMTPQGPNGGRGSPGWYGGTAIGCKTKLPDEAWNFMKHQHSFEVQVTYTRLHSYFPILIEAANDPSWMAPPPEHPEVWLQMTEYAAPDPFTPKWPEVRSILVRDLPLILDGSKKAAEVFPALKEEIDPLLAEGCEMWQNARPCG